MDLGLRGKAAVITGASVGIGLAVTEGLAAEGPTSSWSPSKRSGLKARLHACRPIGFARSCRRGRGDRRGRIRDRRCGGARVGGADTDQTAGHVSNETDEAPAAEFSVLGPCTSWRRCGFLAPRSRHARPGASRSFLRSVCTVQRSGTSDLHVTKAARAEFSKRCRRS